VPLDMMLTSSAGSQRRCCIACLRDAIHASPVLTLLTSENL
jgi:hypothetical protein